MADPHPSVLIDSADFVESTPTYNHCASSQTTPRFERWAQSPEDVETPTDPIAATTGVRVAGGTPSSLTRGYTDLAEQVATGGPAAVEGELWRFIRDTRRRAVTPVLVAILADPNQPEVARQRAFGRIHAELERVQRTAPSTVPSDHDAAGRS